MFSFVFDVRFTHRSMYKKVLLWILKNGLKKTGRLQTTALLINEGVDADEKTKTHIALLFFFVWPHANDSEWEEILQSSP